MSHESVAQVNKLEELLTDNLQTCTQKINELQEMKRKNRKTIQEVIKNYNRPVSLESHIRAHCPVIILLLFRFIWFAAKIPIVHPSNAIRALFQ